MRNKSTSDRLLGFLKQVGSSTRDLKELVLQKIIIELWKVSEYRLPKIKILLYLFQIYI